MAKCTATLDELRLLDTQHVAELLSVTPRALVVWRHRRVGPAYVKVGRMVRYRLADIQEWQKANLEIIATRIA